MDRGGLIIGPGAQLGEPFIEAPHMASPTQFDSFLADIRAKTRHDIDQARRELLAGMHDFSASAITAHCESMATMARAVEHTADAAAAAFERSFAEYRVELARRDERIDNLRDELAHLRDSYAQRLTHLEYEPVMPRWRRELWAWLRFWR